MDIADSVLDRIGNKRKRAGVADTDSVEAADELPDQDRAEAKGSDGGLGREVVVHLMSEHIQFQGIFDPRTQARVGNTLTVAFNMDRMHVFDKQTELAVR